MNEQMSNGQGNEKRSETNSLSATIGSTFTPLLRLIPPERGSVCSVPAIMGAFDAMVTDLR